MTAFSLRLWPRQLPGCRQIQWTWRDDGSYAMTTTIDGRCPLISSRRWANLLYSRVEIYRQSGRRHERPACFPCERFHCRREKLLNKYFLSLIVSPSVVQCLSCPVAISLSLHDVRNINVGVSSNAHFSMHPINNRRCKSVTSHVDSQYLLHS